MSVFYAVCLLLVGIALLYSLASALTAVWSRKHTPPHQQAHAHSIFFGLLPPPGSGSNLKNVTAPVHKRMPRTRGELILPFCTSALPGLAIGFQAVAAGPCLGRRLARNFDRRYC